MRSRRPCAPPAPSSGGIAIAQALNLLETFDLTGKPRAEQQSSIDQIVHRAVIDVAEAGTEAAAATAVAVSVTSMPGQSYTIRLDKPFIYVIYETTTNAIVFMGRVVNP